MGLMRELKQAFGMDSVDESRDIRGWSVMDSSGGTVGRVDDVLYDEDSNELRYAIVNIDNRRVLVPVGELDYMENDRRITVRGYSRERLMGLREYTGEWNETTERETYGQYFPDWKAGQAFDYKHDKFRGNLPQRLVLMEERLRVGKTREQVGEATISKRPITETVSQDVSLTEERIDVQRHAVNRPATGNERIGMDSETVSVPLYAEKVDVNKETFVREEVEINKRTEERTERVSDQVRREELVTDGTETNRRELSFAGTEPTEADLRERRRLERKENLEIVPDDEIRPI